MDRGHFQITPDFDAKARHAVLAFTAPRPNSPADFGDWLMIISGQDFEPVQVCIIGTGYDLPDPSTAVFACEIVLAEAGYIHRRSRPGATLTAAWELEAREPS